MEITWHGHAHFRLRGREGTVVTDPTFRSGGGAPGRMAIDVVTVSHAHPAHCQVAQLGGEPMVLTGPGEYEVKGIVITGIQTFHDAERGRKRGKNTVFRIELDDLVVCHLGDLGHVLTSDQIDQIGNNVDVLFVPVGGGGTIDASQAIEVISLLDPRLVIPMHYRVNDLDLRLDTVDRFLREMGVTGVEAEPRLTVTRTSLPEETSVVVLQPRPF